MAVIKNNKTGMWEVRTYYKDLTGARKQKTKRGFDKKSEALEWERNFKLKEDQSISMSFKSFVDIYLTDLEPRIKRNTFLTKKHIIETKILPYFGKRKLDDIRTSDVIQWQNEIMKLKKDKDVITDPKTPKSNRTIVMPDFLAVEMEDFISSLYGIRDDDRIFTISKSYLHHEMDRGAKLAGVKKIRIHGLRHSHISLLINLGFSALAIGERVGHEAVDITYHYAHLFPTVQTDMAAQLETEREALVNVRKE